MPLKIVRNDITQMKVHDFRGKLITESECVAELLRMYKELKGEL